MVRHMKKRAELCRDHLQGYFENLLKKNLHYCPNIGYLSNFFYQLIAFKYSKRIFVWVTFVDDLYCIINNWKNKLIWYANTWFSYIKCHNPYFSAVFNRQIKDNEHQSAQKVFKYTLSRIQKYTCIFFVVSIFL